MAERDPVFRKSYFDFLRYLDELNNRVAAAGGGLYRQEAGLKGVEPFALAIEAMDGTNHMVVTSNDLGVTCDSMMDEARRLAARYLAEEGLRLSDDERVFLTNLLALAQIAAACNRVIPPDYLSEWELRHPDRPKPPKTPAASVPETIWTLVRRELPWMYHSGAIPWRDPHSTNPHEAYDTFHFFSHAWMANYGIYRQRFAGRFPWLRPSATGRAARKLVRRELVRSLVISCGYEVITMFAVVRSGFGDITSADCLPGLAGRFCRSLGISGLPIIEGLRDVRVDYAGATFGAALAVSSRALPASDTPGHAVIIQQFLAGDAP
jgi:hypothetical protein